VPAPFPQPRSGVEVNNPPTGFPAYFNKRRPRVVTADPWAFIRSLAADQLLKGDATIAGALIDQAIDFYEAARYPRLGSKPLLYYYSFLNLVKAALTIHGVALPASAFHGISDPRANQRTRLRLEGQRVLAEKSARDHRRIFPELVKFLGGDAKEQRYYKVVDLLSQVPSIHRTYTQATGSQSSFIPLREVSVYRDKDNVWARIVLRQKDKDVATSLHALRSRQAFRGVFHQVVATSRDECWFETDTIPAKKRGIDKGILSLATRIRQYGIYTILTSAGVRFYLSSTTPSTRMPQLAAAYALVFYLGSVTRYKPDVFDKITSGGYSWIIEEFLATQPAQFTYSLASHLAGVDVVRPFAAIEPHAA